MKLPLPKPCATLLFAPCLCLLSITFAIGSGAQVAANGQSTAADATIRERVLPALSDDLVVRTSPFGDDLVLLGAAVLVLSGELGVS